MSATFAVNYSWATIGNPGNADDPLNNGMIRGIGAVAYEFWMATTEVTIGDWVEFLNAVAADDPNGLFASNMTNNGNIGNITRSGAAGSYSYAVADDPLLPATFVSYYDAIRYVNWLHNGRPSGPQGPATTESGAYTITGGTTVGPRNPGARYFLPNENEWYKAAYHQPAADGGDIDSFWLYPLRTNDPLFSDQPAGLDAPDASKTANFYRDDGVTNGYNDGLAVTGAPGGAQPNVLYLTPVAAYAMAKSYYGLYDLAGSVREMTETLLGGNVVIRGGGWNGPIEEIASTYWGTNSLGYQGTDRSFRVATSIEPAVTMETVNVGDPGNPPDSLNEGTVPGIGSVGYVYRIGKYEVMNSQYAKFLNSVAATDTYGLYSTNMASDSNGGIVRNGVSGSYTYSVKSGRANMPVTYVSFYDTVRFANWLQNGQPAGAQGPGTTEAGSYTLFTDGDSTTNVSARTSGATWVIPTENEWYKAAYYDPTAIGTSNYWLYPMRTDSPPYSDQPPGLDSPDSSKAGNFLRNDGLVNGYDDGYAVTGSTNLNILQNYMTDAGAYAWACGYYGSFDQGGGVWEWNDTAVLESRRVLRGGCWDGGASSLRSLDRNGNEPWYESAFARLGFRVAMLPKPLSLDAAKPAPSALQLTLSGIVGWTYDIEVSDTLTNWQPWVPVTLIGPNWTTNIVLQPDVIRRFWRAHEEQ